MRTLVSRLIVVALAIPCVECATSGKRPSSAAAVPQAPALASPPEGAVLTFFPRLIDFEWTATPGAARYRIEVDCYGCCATDKWCSDVNPSAVHMQDVVTPKSTIEFPGNQPGGCKARA